MAKGENSGSPGALCMNIKAENSNCHEWSLSEMGLCMWVYVCIIYLIVDKFSSLSFCSVVKRHRNPFIS